MCHTFRCSSKRCLDTTFSSPLRGLRAYGRGVFFLYHIQYSVDLRTLCSEIHCYYKILAVNRDCRRNLSSLHNVRVRRTCNFLSFHSYAVAAQQRRTSAAQKLVHNNVASPRVEGWAGIVLEDLQVCLIRPASRK